MHAALLPPKTAGAAALLDPGLAPAETAPGEGPYFRPGGLPLEGPELSAVMAQYETLGREVRTARELDAFFAARFDDAYGDTSLGIENALRDRMRGGREADRAAAAKAQVGLCLAWRLEEKVLELSGLGEGLDRSLREFAESLGLTDDDADELPEGLLGGAALTDKDTLAGEFQGPWRPLLDAALRFAPEKSALVLTDSRMIGSLADAGLLDLSKSSPEADALVAAELRGRFAAATLPGWRMLGNRPRPGAPWLDVPRTILAALTTEE